MIDPTPTGAAPSITSSEGNRANNAVHSGSGLSTPRKFLAKRTHPRFPNAPPSAQLRVQRPYASRPNELPGAQLNNVSSLHQQSPQRFYADSVQVHAGHNQQSHVPRSPAPPQPQFIQQQPGSSYNLFAFRHDEPVDQYSPTRNWRIVSEAPRRQRESRAYRWTDHHGFNPTTIIDLTQDDPPATEAIPVMVAPEQRSTSISKGARPRPKHPQSVPTEDPFLNLTETPPLNKFSVQSIEAVPKDGVHMPPCKKLKIGSPSVSEASYDLPSTSAICEMLRKRSSASQKLSQEAADGLAQKDWVEEGNNAVEFDIANSVKDKVQIEDIPVNSYANIIKGPVSKKPVQTNDTQKPPGATTGGLRRTRNVSRPPPHGRLDLDAAIYGQPGAMMPPPGVKIRLQTEDEISSQGQRRFIHANPATHLMRDKSKAWHAWKAMEIQSRYGQKFWFGKVSARLRWFRANQAWPRGTTSREDTTRRANRHPYAQTCTHVHSRALDFGDIPEEELPGYVRENTGWLKACEFFRRTHGRREARARASRSCEQETRDFYETVKRAHSSG